MDFLNKAMAQLADLFRSMTVGARITTGLLLTVVVVSLVYLLRFHTSGPDLYLMDGEMFTPAELGNMEMAFASAGLGSYRRDGNRIRIPRGEQAKYMAALAEKSALPGNSFRPLETAINGQGGLFDSNQQRQHRYNVAVCSMISEWIRSMKGVENALVFCSSQETGGLHKDTIKTAVAQVKMQGSLDLDQEKARTIRDILLGSFSGLKPEAVKVIDAKRGLTVYIDPEGGSASLYGDVARAQNFEADYAAKISKRLSYITGALVAVSVQLDPKGPEETRETKPDAKLIALESTEKTRTRTHEGTVPAGRAGSAANVSAALSPTTNKGAKEDEEESTSHLVNTVGMTEKRSVTVGHPLKSVHASVGIPTSHFESVWRRQNPTPPGEEPKTPQPADLDAIRTKEIATARDTVAKLIALEGVADASKFVDVQEYADIPLAPLPEPSTQERAMTWLGRHWSTLGLGFLVLVSLVMLRSTVRAVPATEPRALHMAPTAAGPGRETEAPKKEEAPGQRRLRRLTGTGKTLRDELSDLVAEDPDAAANILRTWIGNVS
jgi:flagellar M-ring protein FliF